MYNIYINGFVVQTSSAVYKTWVFWPDFHLNFLEGDWHSKVQVQQACPALMMLVFLIFICIYPKGSTVHQRSSSFCLI